MSDYTALIPKGTGMGSEDANGLIKTVREEFEAKVIKSANSEGYEVAVVHKYIVMDADGGTNTTEDEITAVAETLADVDPIITLLRETVVVNDKQPRGNDNPEQAQTDVDRIFQERPDLVHVVQAAMDKSIQRSFHTLEVQSKATERRQLWLSVTLTIVSLIVGWLISFVGSPGAILHLIQH